MTKKLTQKLFFFFFSFFIAFSSKAQIIKVGQTTPYLTGSITLFSATSGTASDAQTLTLSCSSSSNSATVQVSVSDDFQVAAYGQAFASNASFYFAKNGDGVFVSQTVYVRFNPASVGNHSGVVTASVGKSFVTVNASGVAIDALSVEEDVKKSSQITVYPNPSSDGILYLQNTSNIPISSVRVVDNFGKVVFSKSGSASVLDLSALPQGLYIVTINNEAMSNSVKVIVK